MVLARSDDGMTDPSGPGPDRLELSWIPLGAGTPVVVVSGRLYETVHAAVHRHPRFDLYHAPLIAHVGGASTVIESARM